MLFLSSCKKEETPLVILISPLTTIISESGEVVVINLEFRCSENITELKILQKNNKNIIDTVCDTIPFGDKFDFVYEVPYEDDSSYVTLDIYAKSNSYSQHISRKVLIFNNSVLIDEYSGNLIYSKLAGKASGFTISNLQSDFVSEENMTNVDFMDYSVDSIHGSNLSRKWISFSGLSFARFNDFNYVQATRRSISDAYSIASKYNIIDNLQNDDILLVGRNDEAVGVIRITDIIDSDSTINDKYYFNIKKIED